MTETDNNVMPLRENGAALRRNPDREPLSRWTYSDMQKEFADITRTIVQNGISRQVAVTYSYNLINNVGAEGYVKELFTEFFMAKTVYYCYVLSNGLKLPSSSDARTLFNEYAALIEAWGDRHYKGFAVSGEDLERLRTDSYSVLGGLTKRALEEDQWRPSPTPKLAPREAMKLVEIISGETERLKKKYLL